MAKRRTKAKRTNLLNHKMIKEICKARGRIASKKFIDTLERLTREIVEGSCGIYDAGKKSISALALHIVLKQKFGKGIM